MRLREPLMYLAKRKPRNVEPETRNLPILPDGSPSGNIHAMTDVSTDEASRPLGKNVRLLELIVDHIDDLIAVINGQGRRVWNNAAYARVLGYTVEALTGSDSLVEVHPSDLEIVRGALQDSLRTGSGRRIEYRLRHRQGHYIYLESQGWVLPGQQEPLLVIISRDISKRKELEERQAELHEQQMLQLQALQKSERMINAQLADAAEYVRSQLPANLEGSIRTEWRYQPSSVLGGDALDFLWLDEDHLAIYVLDVVGHGVGAALLAISILHLLRQRGLGDCDLRDPISVLTALNRAFQMDEHGEKVFSIWYGVFDRQTGTIQFGTAGHPPALLLCSQGNLQPATQWLEARGLPIGATDTASFTGASVVVGQGAELFVFSDGLYELSTDGGELLGLERFGKILVDQFVAGDSSLESVLQKIAQIHAAKEFDDDAAILKVAF
jgi:sigma-B regulation protein RsbU (phosphoserine phosphatase)